MRLINIHTRQLEEFIGFDIPPYYILSHTWESDEISFQDYTWLLDYEAEVEEGIIDELMPKQRARIQAKAESLRNRSGYKKITSFVQLVRSFSRRNEWLPVEFPDDHSSLLGPGDIDLTETDWTEEDSSEELSDTGPSKTNKSVVTDVDYVWIDTCCINKESSAELSEAINSMYMWYNDSRVCVVFLSDVDETKVDTRGEFILHTRWFTRGWTLQELLAPRIVLFYSDKWKYLTTRYRATSRIDLCPGMAWDDDGQAIMEGSSISMRMSWAAKRETTRIEDRAYSLMGIFGVNMPLLYGEGGQAFHRLQREIAGMTADPTIFAWGYDLPINLRHVYGGYSQLDTCIFSRSPNAFLNGHRIGTLAGPLSPFVLTNVGLEMVGLLVRPVLGERGWSSTFLVLTNVGLESGRGIPGIPIVGEGIDNVGFEGLVDGTAVFRATGHPVQLPYRILRDPKNYAKRKILLRRELLGSRHFSKWRPYEPYGKPGVDVELTFGECLKVEIHEVWPNSAVYQGPTDVWVMSQHILLAIGHHPHTVIVRIAEQDRPISPGKQYALALCLSPNSEDWYGGTLFAYGRLYPWEAFARRGGESAQDSIAGLLCDCPDVLDPGKWPPASDAIDMYKVEVRAGARVLKDKFQSHEFSVDIYLKDMDSDYPELKTLSARKTLSLGLNSCSSSYERQLESPDPLMDSPEELEESSSEIIASCGEDTIAY
ncbi:hypothetical protein V8F20_001843 [Naviculisporaceae sp. PSN 640]